MNTVYQIDEQAIQDLQGYNYKQHPIYTHLILTNDGNVYSLKRHKFLKPRNNVAGYLQINVNQQKMYLHRLIWEAFNGPIPNDKEVDHLDNDGTNNHLSNLQLLSHKENIQKNPNPGNPLITRVVAVNLDTQEESVYQSVKQASNDLGCHDMSIYNCLNGKQAKAKSQTLGVWFTFHRLLDNHLKDVTYDD